jgi:hypothetical protein
MLRIDKSGNGHVVFTLSGRIEAEDLAELQQLLAKEAGSDDVLLDLKDVTLVSRDAVEFLTHCEGKRVKLQRCPGYIREWINQGKRAIVNQ